MRPWYLLGARDKDILVRDMTNEKYVWITWENQGCLRPLSEKEGIVWDSRGIL